MERGGNIFCENGKVMSGQRAVIRDMEKAATSMSTNAVSMELSPAYYPDFHLDFLPSVNHSSFHRLGWLGSKTEEGENS